jgi:hypothetical protein
MLQHIAGSEMVRTSAAIETAVNLTRNRKVYDCRLGHCIVELEIGQERKAGECICLSSVGG